MTQPKFGWCFDNFCFVLLACFVLLCYSPIQGQHMKRICVCDNKEVCCSCKCDGCYQNLGYVHELQWSRSDIHNYSKYLQPSLVSHRWLEDKFLKFHCNKPGKKELREKILNILCRNTKNKGITWELEYIRYQLCITPLLYMRKQGCFEWLLCHQGLQVKLDFCLPYTVKYKNIH